MINTFLKIKIIISTFSLLLLLLILNLINYLLKFEIGIVVYWHRGIVVIVTFICLLLIKDLKINKLNYGMYIYTVLTIIYLIEAYQIFPVNFISYIFVAMNLSFLFILLGIIELLLKHHDYDIRLKHLAFHDLLTGLPNRNFLMSQCPLSIANECIKCEHCSIEKFMTKKGESAFLFLDIDDFKLVNDFFGHFNGDALLIEISKRITSTIDNDDFVIHLSGDEFVIIINNLEKKDLVYITNKIIQKINDPIYLENKEVNTNCSIGIALFPSHGDTIEKLLKKSDIAMNEAKKNGKNKYLIFNFELNEKFNSRFLEVVDLKRAIKNDEFIIYYQPKANLKTNEIIGLEALIRWNHPKLGLVYPNDFIPLAEEMKIIDEIDKIVLNKVCKQIRDWLDIGKEPYNIALNISPLFFNENNFIEILDQIIETHQINPEYIGIEITESVAINNSSQTIKKLKLLKERKIMTYIDDFGKGYSSISCIKDLPFDYLKIDKKFIDGININEVDNAIIKYIIDISNILNIKVISEGIENNEQLEFLKDIDCFAYQGYLLSRPKPIEELNLIFKE